MSALASGSDIGLRDEDPGGGTVKSDMLEVVGVFVQSEILEVAGVLVNSDDESGSRG